MHPDTASESVITSYETTRSSYFPLLGYTGSTGPVLLLSNDSQVRVFHFTPDSGIYKGVEF